MSSFTTPLRVEALDDGSHWKIIEPFSFWYEYKGVRREIIVNPGFITDFASVPRILWSILPPYDKYGKAAVIHDFCYGNVCFPRKECDYAFKVGMEVLKVPKWKIYVMWLGVRLFGWYVYNKYKRKKLMEMKMTV